MTIDPFVGIAVFIAKLSERQYCWRVFEEFHSQEHIQLFDKLFFSGMIERTPDQKSTKTEHTCAQEKRASLKTSWTEGTTSPEPPTGRLSSSDRLKARAAVHARIAPPSHPCGLSPTLQDQRHFLGTCSGQGCEELRCLTVPPHQLRQRGPQAERDHLPRRAQGRLFPSCVAPPPTQHHRDQLPLAELYRLF